MRYAIYFTPGADDPLTVAAQAWLGRSAFACEPMEMPRAEGFTADELQRCTAEPRRYGFHATLVAPFRLRAGLDEGAIRKAADAFAASRTAFAIPRLAISRLGSFIALTPAAPCPALDALAATAVDHFSELRAPLTEREIERRRPERLTPRQRAYLDRFGYPYVKEEFRFHMTLTGSLEPDVAARIEPSLQAHFSGLLDRPVQVGAATIFVEPEPGADFMVHSTHRFGAAEARKSA